MDSLTIRVSRSTRATLGDLAEKTGVSMLAIVDEAVKLYQEKLFWAEYHEAYSALKADPAAWADYQKEIAGWDATMADGLEAAPDAQG